MSTSFKEDNGNWYYRTEIYDNLIFGPFASKEEADSEYYNYMKPLMKKAEKINAIHNLPNS